MVHFCSKWRRRWIHLKNGFRRGKINLKKLYLMFYAICLSQMKKHIDQITCCVEMSSRQLYGNLESSQISFYHETLSGIEIFFTYKKWQFKRMTSNISFKSFGTEKNYSHLLRQCK